PEGTVDLDDIAAVWYRRFAPARALPEATAMRSAAVRESHAALTGLIEVLPVFHLDDVVDVRRADNKLLQLKWASEVGLPVPETLVTNDEHAVRRFARACTDGFVAKTLSSFVVTDSDGAERAVYTSLVRDEDLEDMSGLRLSPMQFQELVPKAFDVRCTVVGTRVFTAVLEAPTHDDGCVDWRIKGSELADAWLPHALPPHIEVALRALLDRLGLNYGAIDMIVTPEGDYVFLEVNPAGEFLWLDELVSPSISDALADVLVGVGRRV
ncbi:MAG: MvdD family ATP-grasp ribosomal peptide maturase, partial [Chloroflexota bacterium]|nr:MvdD family ATP-grasp ribosomal peptide maturase [Chloroflexota bacterium]